MNAKMLVKSIENEGTEFTFIFPKAEPPEKDSRLAYGTIKPIV
jgi:hypothetical protein